MSSMGGLMRLISRYWNAALALAALGAIALYTLIPGAGEHINTLLFVCATAIVTLLVDIRVEMDSSLQQKGKTYESMHAAREDIILKMSDAIAKSGPEATEIHIIGGRIRTVTDMLRHLVSDLKKGAVHGENVEFKVMCMNPSFLRDLRLPGEAHPTGQGMKNQSYASMIEAAAGELSDIAGSMVLQQQGIRVTTSFYDYLPHYYCFLINRRCLFWGFYRWERNSSDLSGPDNRCFFLDHSHPDFDDYYRWFQNRYELNEAFIDMRMLEQQT